MLRTLLCAAASLTVAESASEFLAEASDVSGEITAVQVVEAKQQAQQSALLNLVLDTVDAFQRLHVNGTDIKKQLERLVSDASTAQDGYVQLHSERRLPWQLEEKRRLPPIGFVKTPRTGSSSITGILQRLADSKNLHTVLPEDDQDLGHLEPLPVDALGLVQNRHSYDLICHHAVFDDSQFRQYLRAAPFLFTVLRSPAMQIRSTFEDRVESATDFLGYDVEVPWPDRIEWMDMLWKDSFLLTEGLTAADRARFMNPQAYDLGWYRHTGGTKEFDQDVHKIERWVDQIQHNMSFVLLTEYFDEGLVLLRRKLGLDLKDMAYLFSQRARVRPVSEPTEKEAGMISELNLVDARLYDRFNRSFWEQWEAEGGHIALRADLQELKLWNRVLQKACEKQSDHLCTRAVQSGNVDFTKHLKAKRASTM